MNDNGGAVKSSTSGQDRTGPPGGANVVELNVGGVIYATLLSTLTHDPGSLLARLFASDTKAGCGGGSGGGLVRDGKGRYFLDRDGVLFRYVLDFLRNDTLVLPDCFHEKERLRREAEYFRLPGMLKYIGPTDWTSTSHPPPPRHLTPSPTPGGGDAQPHSPVALSADNVSPSALGPPGGPWRTNDSGYITVGYRGTFAFGRDGAQADVKFRKLWRILVSGKVALCREVFRDTLNESRDVDRGTSDRYSARFFLKHTFIEQAFDALQEAGFRMVGSAGSGTNSAGDMKPGMDSEECKWNHYNEFIFCR